MSRERRSTISLAVAVLALVLGGAPVSALEPWVFGAEVGGGYDSNPRNADLEDREAGSVLRAALSGSYEARFTPYTAVQLRASVAGEHDLDWDQLSNGRAESRLRLLHKPGASFHAPTLAAWVALGARDYGSGMRDGYDYRGGAYLSEPLTTRVNARLDATVARREASSRVFDLEERALALSLDWQAADSLNLYLSYRHGTGDIAVTARGEVPVKTYHALYLEPAADAIEPDDAYREDWLAYRLEATTQAATFGANVPLAANLALDVQVLRATAELDAGYRYERWLSALTLLLRF